MRKVPGEANSVEGHFFIYELLWCDGWRRSRERQTNLSRSPGCYLRIWCFAVFICWCICNRIECHCGCCFGLAAACQNMFVSAVSVRVNNEICPRHPDPCSSTRTRLSVISLRAWAGRDAAIRLAVGRGRSQRLILFCEELGAGWGSLSLLLLL